MLFLRNFYYKMHCLPLPWLLNYMMVLTKRCLLSVPKVTENLYCICLSILQILQIYLLGHSVRALAHFSLLVFSHHFYLRCKHWS